MGWFSKLLALLRPKKELEQMEQFGKDLMLAFGRGVREGRAEVFRDLAIEMQGCPPEQLTFEGEDPDVIEGEAVVVAASGVARENGDPVIPEDWGELKDLAREHGVRVGRRTKSQLRTAVKRALAKMQRTG